MKEFAALGRRSFHTDFWALRDINFDIRRGETFCIVGENGSGKSTLLQVIAGILRPTLGVAEIRGRVTALLELGAGFNPEFTGRDNVYLNAAILGFSQKELDRKFGAITEFAEIGDFMNQPVKTYSSGMIVRLAFAVAIHLDPEILLVDEALAVGDVYFRQRCMRKVHELRAQGVTILFVSHSTADIKAMGDRALWLEHGRQKMLGDTETVISHYLAAMVEKDSRYLVQKHDTHDLSDHAVATVTAPEVVEQIPYVDHRHGDRRAEVIGIVALDSFGQPMHMLQPSSSITVRISVRAQDRIALPIVGFMLRDHMGIDFAGTNTSLEDFELPLMRPGDVYTVDFHVQLPELYPSSFSFSPAIADGTLNGYRMCDWIDNALVLQMSRGATPIYGHLRLPCRVELNKAFEVRIPETQLG